MRAWQRPYLGLRRLPPELTDFEIQHFFTLDAGDRRRVRSRYKDVHRLAAALQIGLHITLLPKVPLRIGRHINGIHAQLR